MKHRPAFRYSDGGNTILPACSCGRWTGNATRWTSQAHGQFNVHAQTVGAPGFQVVGQREVWARRYLSGARPYGGDAA